MSDPSSIIPANPTLLAVDTSSASCSAALLHRGALQCIVERLGHGHSRRLLPMLDELLAQHRLTPADCDAIGFGAGPGAFTGLRIACGVAQGLGWASDRPVVPVDCLAATALQALRLGGGPTLGQAREPAVAVVLDARMDQVYFALHETASLAGMSLAGAPLAGASHRAGDASGDAGPGAAPRVGDPLAAGAALLAQWRAAGAPPLICAGDGFERYAEALAPLRAAAARIAPQAHARADAVALCAERMLAGGGRFDAADAAPRYVRDKVALDVDEQRALRAARAAP